MTTDLVTIANFDDPTTAGLVQQRLEASGIEAVLADDATVGIAWHLSPALGGIRLKVKAQDEKEARLLLESHHQADTEMEIPAGCFPADEGDVASPQEEKREALVKRAFMSGVIGLILAPVLLYSLVLVVRAVAHGGVLSLGGKVRLGVTLVMVPVVIAAWVLFYWKLG